MVVTPLYIEPKESGSACREYLPHLFSIQISVQCNSAPVIFLNCGSGALEAYGSTRLALKHKLFPHFVALCNLSELYFNCNSIKCILITYKALKRGQIFELGRFHTETIGYCRLLIYYKGNFNLPVIRSLIVYYYVYT